MPANPQLQIVHSAQVWVCNGCGTQDSKSCSCNSTAHMEEKAAKREANRQHQKKSREKAQQNQQPRQSDTTVDNTNESLPGDDSHLGGLKPLDPRTVVYRGIVNGLVPILASPFGRELTNDFLREVFEEFLTKRGDVS